MKNAAIAVLVTIIAIGGALATLASTNTVETEANVEVTVWQKVSDGSLYLSTRPEGGRWTTHNTPLDMSGLSKSGRYRQGSAITVAVPVSVEAPAETPKAPPVEADGFSISCYWYADSDGKAQARVAIQNKTGFTITADAYLKYRSPGIINGARLQGLDGGWNNGDTLWWEAEMKFRPVEIENVWVHEIRMRVSGHIGTQTVSFTEGEYTGFLAECPEVADPN